MDSQVFDLILQGQKDQKDAIDDLKRVVEEGFKAMNGRVRTAEKDIVRLKTILGITGTTFSVILGWIGTHWGGFKAWLISP